MAGKRTPRKKCSTPLCRNLRVPKKKNGESNGAKCYKCRARIYRAANPYFAAYRAQKDHAQARGISFTVGFQYWKRFAEESGLLQNRGLSANALTVDRKDNLKGYEEGNLQAMTRAKNSEKAAKRDAIRMKQGYAWKEQPDEELPDSE